MPARWSSPKSRHVIADAAAVKPSTRKSRRDLDRDPRPASRHHADQAVAEPERKVRLPMRPPANDSNRLSAISCRMIAPGPAPIASRTEISRRRAVARANSRFARFEQAD